MLFRGESVVVRTQDVVYEIAGRFKQYSNERLLHTPELLMDATNMPVVDSNQALA